MSLCSDDALEWCNCIIEHISTLITISRFLHFIDICQMTGGICQIPRGICVCKAPCQYCQAKKTHISTIYKNPPPMNTHSGERVVRGGFWKWWFCNVLAFAENMSLKWWECAVTAWCEESNIYIYMLVQFWLFYWYLHWFFDWYCGWDLLVFQKGAPMTQSLNRF